MDRVQKFIHKETDTSALPVIMDFVRVPAVSPLFDPLWEDRGLLDQAFQLMLGWTLEQGLAGLRYEVLREAGKAPFLFLEIAGMPVTAPTVVFYGHLDKQPPTTGWSDFCGPYNPVIRDGYVYGRGCADDGYALTSVVLSLKCCQHLQLPHCRCVVLIENEEESGSPNLLSNLSKVQPLIGTPALILSLDTSAGDYHRLWYLESLRGILRFDLTAKVLSSSMHSGTACGVVPSPFLVLRRLIERLEDEETGRVKLPELYADVDPEQYKRTLGAVHMTPTRVSSLGAVPGAQTVTQDQVQLNLNRTWRPTLSVIGMTGAPGFSVAGSAMLSELTLTCSIRLPPTVNGDSALSAVKRTILNDEPWGAKVTITNTSAGEGWAMKPLEPAILKACTEASIAFFGNSPQSNGGGGSIPFVGALQTRFPTASFLLIGAAGPDTNAHGPDERLNIEYYEKLNCCLVYILQVLSRPS